MAVFNDAKPIGDLEDVKRTGTDDIGGKDPFTTTAEGPTFTSYWEISVETKNTTFNSNLPFYLEVAFKMEGDADEDKLYVTQYFTALPGGDSLVPLAGYYATPAGKENKKLEILSANIYDQPAV